MKTKWKNFLGYGFGLIVVLVILYWGGAKAIELAVSPRLGYLFLCLLANVAVYGVSSFRWGYITNTIFERKVTSYPRYFSYFVSSRFFGQYISQSGGDFIFKPSLLKQIDGVSLKFGLSTIIIEKLYDVMLIGILLIPSILYFFDVINEILMLVIAGLLAVILLIFLLFQTANLAKILTGIFRFGFYIIGKIPIIKRFALGKNPFQTDNFQKLSILGKKNILGVYALSILRFFLLITRIYLLNLSLELGIPITLFIVGIPIAQLALAFAITPGALGILEGGWYAILSIGGIGEIEIGAFLIGQRVYWSLFIGIIFLITYLTFGISKIKKTKPNEYET
jgi:uncharacterized protein (TIRG00374 family)